MKIKFLLIDDDKISLLISKKYMVVSGLKEIVEDVIVFDKPQDALDYIYSEKSNKEPSFFWILLDINMPEINGWEFLRLVDSNELGNMLKVIVLTSSISEDDKNRAASFNTVFGYISKPLDLEKC